MARCRRWCSVLTLLVPLRASVAGIPAEPKELIAERSQFQADVHGRVAPLAKKYVKKLESLQKRLTRKGDVEGAMAVKKEIGRVELLTLDLGPVVGTWDIRFSNRVTREYRITAGAEVPCPCSAQEATYGVA